METTLTNLDIRMLLFEIWAVQREHSPPKFSFAVLAEDKPHFYGGRGSARLRKFQHVFNHLKATTPRRYLSIVAFYFP